MAASFLEMRTTPWKKSVSQKMSVAHTVGKYLIEAREQLLDIFVHMVRWDLQWVDLSGGTLHSQHSAAISCRSLYQFRLQSHTDSNWSFTAKSFLRYCLQVLSTSVLVKHFQSVLSITKILFVSFWNNQKQVWTYFLVVLTHRPIGGAFSEVSRFVISDQMRFCTLIKTHLCCCNALVTSIDVCSYLGR